MPTTDRADPTERPTLPRRFLALWSGQTASLVGTDVSAFGVIFVAFIETGSLTWLAVLFLAGRVPALVVSSHAGGLVDRTSARSVLILADAAAGVATSLAFALHLSGSLELWHLVVLTMVGSTANAYQLPAYQAAVPRLVPTPALPRAHGMLQTAPAAGLLAGPALAGVLVAWGGIGGILVFDLITFFIAIGVTASVRIPDARTDESGSTADGEPIAGSLRFMWHHLSGARRGVLQLVIWGALLNFAATAVNLLLPALLLSITTERTSGFVLAIGGMAMLASSATVSAAGLPSGLSNGLVSVVVRGTTVIGLGVVLIALRPTLALVVAGVVLTLAALPVVAAASGAIHQTHVAEEFQGRLTAFRRVASEALMIPAVLVVTPLVDRYVEPAMVAGGGAASVFGPVIGVGEGRGIALTIVFAGVILIALSVGMSCDPWLRRLGENVKVSNGADDDFG